MILRMVGMKKDGSAKLDEKFAQEAKESQEESKAKLRHYSPSLLVGATGSCTTVTTPAPLLAPPPPEGGGGAGKYTLSGTCLTPFASGSCDGDEEDRPPSPAEDEAEGGVVLVGFFGPTAGGAAGRGTNLDATFQYFSKSSARTGDIPPHQHFPSQPQPRANQHT